MKLNPSKFAV